MTPKLVFSKKGFDTENGGGPSPILPDARMVPLPIPEPRTGVSAATFGSLNHEGGSYADLLQRLGYAIAPQTPAHLDPDLIASARQRSTDWVGMFGQVDQAESHLANEGVDRGSLFLFWGWYAHAIENQRIARTSGFSSLFGYLEVDYVVDVGRDPIPPFAPYHPHFSNGYPRARNRVYIARRQLSWNAKKPGWGVFKFSPKLRLSVEGKQRSCWRLPGMFHPDEGIVLTFNTKRELWSDPGPIVELQIPARGQEFVCSLTGRVAEWVTNLIDEAEVWSSFSPAVATALPQPFVPAQIPVRKERKETPAPLDGERLVSYGDRLLWHQLGLQLNGKTADMLTEDEYLATILNYFPDAVVQNVRQYRSYFNGRHKSMGFRDGTPMPIPVRFA